MTTNRSTIDLVFSSSILRLNALKGATPKLVPSSHLRQALKTFISSSRPSLASAVRSKLQFEGNTNNNKDTVSKKKRKLFALIERLSFMVNWGEKERQKHLQSTKKKYHLSNKTNKQTKTRQKMAPIREPECVASNIPVASPTDQRILRAKAAAQEARRKSERTSSISGPVSQWLCRTMGIIGECKLHCNSSYQLRDHTLIRVCRLFLVMVYLFLDDDNCHTRSDARIN